MTCPCQDEHPFTLRQVDLARADFAAITDDLESIKAQLAGLPSRAYVGRTVPMATASIWALLGAVALLMW